MFVEVRPNCWRFVKKTAPAKRSELPFPHVISDTMDAVEQVDGKFYTSKRAFRAVGRALGLTEVGNEKFKPFVRSTAKRETKAQRMAALKVAVEKYKAGQRPRQRRGG
jgi:hypothetical protein